MSDKTLEMVFLSLNYDQTEITYYLVGYAIENGRNYLASDGKFDRYRQRKLRAVYKTLDKEQRLLVDFLVNWGISQFEEIRMVEGGRAACGGKCREKGDY